MPSCHFFSGAACEGQELDRAEADQKLPATRRPLEVIVNLFEKKVGT